MNPYRFYTQIPSPKEPRTFIKLPGETDVAVYFHKALNEHAKSEKNAHESMFTADTNKGYEELESETLRLIGEAVTLARRAA